MATYTQKSKVTSQSFFNLLSSFNFSGGFINVLTRLLIMQTILEKAKAGAPDNNTDILPLPGSYSPEASWGQDWDWSHQTVIVSNPESDEYIARTTYHNLSESYFPIFKIDHQFYNGSNDLPIAPPVSFYPNKGTRVSDIFDGLLLYTLPLRSGNAVMAYQSFCGNFSCNTQDINLLSFNATQLKSQKKIGEMIDIRHYYPDGQETFPFFATRVDNHSTFITAIPDVVAYHYPDRTEYGYKNVQLTYFNTNLSPQANYTVDPSSGIVSRLTQNKCISGRNAIIFPEASNSRFVSATFLRDWKEIDKQTVYASNGSFPIITAQCYNESHAGLLIYENTESSKELKRQFQLISFTGESATYHLPALTLPSVGPLSRYNPTFIALQHSHPPFNQGDILIYDQGYSGSISRDVITAFKGMHFTLNYQLPISPCYLINKPGVEQTSVTFIETQAGVHMKLCPSNNETGVFSIPGYAPRADTLMPANDTTNEDLNILKAVGSAATACMLLASAYAARRKFGFFKTDKHKNSTHEGLLEKGLLDNSDASTTQKKYLSC